MVTGLERMTTLDHGDNADHHRHHQNSGSESRGAL